MSVILEQPAMDRLALVRAMTDLFLFTSIKPWRRQIFHIVKPSLGKMKWMVCDARLIYASIPITIARLSETFEASERRRLFSVK